MAKMMQVPSAAQMKKIQAAAARKLAPVIKEREENEARARAEEEEKKRLAKVAFGQRLGKIKHTLKAFQEKDKVAMFICHDVTNTRLYGFKNDLAIDVTPCTETVKFGSCSCSPYVVKTPNVAEIPEVLKDYILIKDSTDGLKFLKLKPEVQELFTRKFKFMEEQFADAFFAVKMIDEKDASSKDKLINMLQLGTISQAYQKEFPDASMKEFTLIYKQMEAAFYEEVSKG